MFSALRSHRAHDKGVTLIELIVTIAVIALVAGIGYPVVTNTLDAAQSTAISSQQRIVDSFANDWTSGNYTVTQGSGAYDGYVIAYADENGNGAFDDGETLVGKVQGTLAPADAPTAVTATAVSGTELHLTWTVPAYSGSLKTTGYNVQYSTTADFSENVDVVATTSNVPSATLSGLTSGETYYVVVAANSAVGSGAFSTVTTVIMPSTPNTPTALDIAPTSGTTLTVSWTAPANDGGSPITGYRVELSTTSDFAVDAEIVDTGASTTSYTFTGLTPGTIYYSRVSATNALGTSTSTTTSFAATLTVATAPTAPTSLSLAIASGTSLTATWTAPTDDGGTPVTSYRVTYATASDFSAGLMIVDTGSTATAKTLTGLAAGTTYYAKVAATNAVGTGAASATDSQAPAAAPAAPNAPTATLTGLTTASLDWAAPSANGSAISGYTVTSIPTGPVATVSGASATVSGLVAGTTYTFTATATNAMGTSSASAASNSVTAAAAPAAPTGLALTIASSTSLTASWTAPANVNGSAITSYRVTYSTSADFTTGITVVDTGEAVPSSTITGLTPGTLYFVRVAATNAVGTGTASTVNSKIPMAPPSAPAAPTATLTGPTTASLTWTAPATNGISIAGYTVTSTPATGVSIANTGTATTATISGLTAGTSYTFTVKAVANVVGAGAASPASNTITAAAAPDAPTGLALSIASGTSLTASWTAPANVNGSAITSYRVMYSVADDFASTVQIIDTGASATTATITGLTAGTTYYVKVAATNAVGSGAYSTAGVKTPVAAITVAYATTAFAAPGQQLTPTVTGGASGDGTGKTYSFSGTLPAGVTFNAATGTFTGPGGVTWTSATSVGSTGADTAGGIVTAADGSSYITGQFTGTAAFGSTSLTSNGSSDLVVAKLSAAGSWLWATSVGGAAADVFGGITLDAGGNVLITGTVGSVVTAGSTTTTWAGASDIFVAKLSPSGTWLWATTAGGTGNDQGYGVTATADGGVAISGYVQTTATFGAAGSVTSAGSNDIVVAKLTSAGTWSWAARTGSTGTDTAYDIAANADGTLMATGRYTGTATFGSTTLTSAGGTDVVVAKLSSSGSWLWAVSGGGTGADGAWRMDVDGSGNAFVTGYISGTSTFGSASVAWSGAQDIFVAKVSSSGTWLWAKSVGSTGGDWAYGLAVDGNGDAIIAAYFTGSVTVGSTALTSAGGSDALVAKISSAGTWLWAVAGGGTLGDIAYDVDIDASGAAAVAINYNGTATFGSTVTASGGTDIAVARIGGNGAGFPAAVTVTVTDSTGSVDVPLTLTTASAPGIPSSFGYMGFISTAGTIMWNAPAANGSPITSYRVTVSTSSDFTTGTTVEDTGSSSTSKMMSGLTPGARYYVKIAATNAIGTGTALSTFFVN